METTAQVLLLITEIEWDVSDTYGEVPDNLPNRVTMINEFYTDSTMDEQISDILSDIYGYCVKNFVYEII